MAAESFIIIKKEIVAISVGKDTKKNTHLQEMCQKKNAVTRAGENLVMCREPPLYVPEA